MRRALARPLYAALVVILLFIPTLAAQQTGTVSGTVVAAESGAPLAGASVVIVGTARSVLTNEKGEYRLGVAAGTHAVRARLIGYEPAEQRVTVTAGQTVTADFKLTATPLSVNEVVVVGARTSRTATETPVPVDVITAQEMTETGVTEVNQMLATLEPSFNASHQTIADGSDHVNPASLRGLGPDQVLVLVNGKRRYSSALVHVNGTFGRGTVGVDLNAIPAARPIARRRIRVTRSSRGSPPNPVRIRPCAPTTARARTSRCAWGKARRPRGWRSTMRSCRSARPPRSTASVVWGIATGSRRASSGCRVRKGAWCPSSIPSVSSPTSIRSSTTSRRRPASEAASMPGTWTSASRMEATGSISSWTTRTTRRWERRAPRRSTRGACRSARRSATWTSSDRSGVWVGCAQCRSWRAASFAGRSTASTPGGTHPGSSATAGARPATTLLRTPAAAPRERA